MRLFVDITAHGWGHLSQTAPIIAALRERDPSFGCVVRSGLPRDMVERKLGPLAGFHASESDFGLVMTSPFIVDREASLARYLSLHRDFDRHVDALAALISDGCDAVLSNIGYLALAAGKRAGIPTIACSSLNWSDMMHVYGHGAPGAAGVLADIDRSYAEADLFLRLSPGMAMERFRTRRIDRPIARLGTARRGDIRQRLGIGADAPIVVCAFGGMIPMGTPAFINRPDGLAVLGPPAWRDLGVLDVDGLGMPYADVLASADLVVTKPGYGIVAELGCLGTPSLMVSRGDWPEQPALLAWLADHSSTAEIDDIRSLAADDVHIMIKRARDRVYTPAESGGERDIADAIKALVYAN